MKRSISWRRHIKEVKTIRRLKILTFRGWWYRDANDSSIDPEEIHSIMDYINLREEHVSKTISINSYFNTNYKNKYSPNKRRNYSDFNTREYQNRKIRKIRKEYGIN